MNALIFSLQEDAIRKPGSMAAKRKSARPACLEERILLYARHSDPPKVILQHEKCTGEKVCKIVTRLIVNAK